MGRWVHVYGLKMKGMEMDIMVEIAMLDMYAKCGKVDMQSKFSSECREGEEIMVKMEFFYGEILGDEKKQFGWVEEKDGGNEMSFSRLVGQHSQLPIIFYYQ
ncbi:hypothetical protein F3Y22_tig00110610pilonHSYRG00582 [Hibiscus syriacus]|uniref:Uncharacterized protein n=1 Tax=Hibiscus syriacus TaxID=106335 RepID=A0A6A3A0M4_HIBSY|nr:hypothetical protein F3Y22_tig00110610pilonHSYRG00582 [Hibiscus syriacus]